MGHNFPKSSIDSFIDLERKSSMVGLVWSKKLNPTHKGVFLPYLYHKLIREQHMSNQKEATKNE